MSDNDGEYDEEQNYEYVPEPDSSEEEMEEEEDSIDIEEIDNDPTGVGQKTSDYMDSLSVVPEHYLKKIPETFSKMQKEEYIRLLTYRGLIQRYGLKTVKVAVSVENIVNDVKIIHKNEEPETNIDGHIEKILHFIDNRLATAFTLNLNKYSKEIYDTGLFYLKVLTLSHLTSKKVIGIMSASAVNAVLNNIYNGLLRGIIDPGEMVGCQIATGLSEPLSQMTLNTFHLSGNSEKSKINSGMSRIVQIFNVTKTENLLDDCYMFLYFKPQDEKNMDKIARIITKFNTINMYTLVEKISIIQDNDYLYGEKSLINSDLVGITKFLKNGRKLPLGLSKLCIAVDFVPDELYKVRFSIFDVEASLLKQYPDLFILHISPSRIRIYVRRNVELEYFKNLIGSLKTTVLSGINGIMGVDINEEKVEYRKENSALAVRTINRLFAKGVNFRKIVGSKYINGYKSVTNDLHETLNTLGLNATKVVMYNEIRKVYNANGANISPAIIKTLVDAITCKGFIAPINNIGMKISESSTIQQMTFEKSEQVITDAALYSKKESVDGTSNNILFGQPFRGGTNYFQLMM